MAAVALWLEELSGQATSTRWGSANEFTYRDARLAGTNRRQLACSFLYPDVLRAVRRPH